jgi:MYXO-CTERM domain-containing protein
MKRAFRLSISRAALLGSLLSASPAFAHIDLLEPEARSHGTGAGDTDADENTDQKTGPCGQVANGRTARVTTFAPGETITVRVREETPHDSYIRVSLDLDGDTFPMRPTVSTTAETQEVAQAAEEALGGDTLLGVFRENNNTPDFVHELEVTLPNETCDNCTLQVIQFMYGAADPFYHQCADLVIAEGGGSGSDAGTSAGAGGSPSGGSGGVATAGAGSSAAGGASVNRAGAGGSGGTPAVGSAGSASTAAGGSTLTGAAGSSAAPVVSDDDAEDEGGCALTGPARGTAMPALFGLIALGLGGLVRRRRS